MPRWFAVKLKRGICEKHAPSYARKSAAEGHVCLTNGANVCFAVTVEEARRKYDLGEPLSEERSKQIEDRYQWELNR